MHERVLCPGKTLLAVSASTFTFHEEIKRAAHSHAQDVGSLERLPGCIRGTPA